MFDALLVQRSSYTQSGGNSVNTSSFPYIEVLRERDGRDGRDGVPGPCGPQLRTKRRLRAEGRPSGNRSPWTKKWRGSLHKVGRKQLSKCLSITLVYAGRAGGTWYQKREEQLTTSACLMIQTILCTMLQGTLICSEVESGICEHTQSLHALRMIANMIETTD